MAESRGAGHEEEGKPKFRLYFGMCAGVGKTYAMIQEATAAKASGMDIIVGIIDTHGRPEVERLLRGLEGLPSVIAAQSPSASREMDVDALLERKPAAVLVDDLATANPPGSRHAKRWQDVLELLDHGIGVWTTASVQHIESLSDVVEGLTGERIRERVPDTVIDRADEIRLIDAAPGDILHRLAEGKIPSAGPMDGLTQNLFSQRNLRALRELALRFAARAAERGLHAYSRAEGSLDSKGYSEGKILVAIGPSPNSAFLVRWARRTAWALHSSWVALHVDPGSPLGAKDAERLKLNLSLARKLGAETILVQAEDVAGSILETARAVKATMIVVGRSGLSRMGYLPRRPTVPDRVIREAGPIDVAVVQDAAMPGKRLTLPRLKAAFVSSWREYAFLVASFIAVTAAGVFLEPLIGHRSMALVYLAAVLGLSFLARPAPVAVFAVLSAFVLNYFFMTPRFTFRISTADDIVLFVTYFLVAFVTGSLVARLRTKARLLLERERRNSFLLSSVQRLAECGTIQAAAEMTTLIVKEFFAAESLVFVSAADGGLSRRTVGNIEDVDNPSLEAAQYTFSRSVVCGHGTETFAAARLRCVPAAAGERAAGVIAILTPPSTPWRPSEDSLLLALGRTLAFVIEREHAEARRRETALELASERFSKVLLDSVSHELRTPLTTITGSLSALTDKDLAARPEARTALIEGALEASTRLDRIVEDILSMSRIEGGALALAPTIIDLEDLSREAFAKAGPGLDPIAIALFLIAYRFIKHCPRYVYHWSTEGWQAVSKNMPPY